MEQAFHILVVDDDPLKLRGLLRVLESAGYQLTQASTGYDCLHLVKQVYPDLILLDVNLPDIDGIELCRLIKTDPDLANILVIHLSALRTTTGDQIDGLEAGADGYLIYPISNKELLARIKVWVRLKRSEDELRSRTIELERAKEQLERKVLERTIELEQKTISLQEANTTLKVLLEYHEKEKAAQAQNILSVINKTVVPYIARLKSSNLESGQLTNVNIIEQNLASVTSSFAQRLVGPEMGLTSKELDVIQLIREGMSTKEIAELLNSSTHAISFHRKNIRKKLGISGKEVSLRFQLMNLFHG